MCPSTISESDTSSCIHVLIGDRSVMLVGHEIEFSHCYLKWCQNFNLGFWRPPAARERHPLSSRGSQVYDKYTFNYIFWSRLLCSVWSRIRINEVRVLTKFAILAWQRPLVCLGGLLSDRDDNQWQPVAIVGLIHSYRTVISSPVIELLWKPYQSYHSSIVPKRFKLNLAQRYCFSRSN